MLPSPEAGCFLGSSPRQSPSHPLLGVWLPSEVNPQGLSLLHFFSFQAEPVQDEELGVFLSEMTQLQSSCLGNIIRGEVAETGLLATWSRSGVRVEEVRQKPYPAIPGAAHICSPLCQDLTPWTQRWL